MLAYISNIVYIQALVMSKIFSTPLILLVFFCVELRKPDTTGGTKYSSPVSETQTIKEVSQDRTTSMSSAIYESPIQVSVSG